MTLSSSSSALSVKNQTPQQNHRTGPAPHGEPALTPLAPFREQTHSSQFRPRKWIPSGHSSTLSGSPRTVKTVRTCVWHPCVRWPGPWAAGLAGDTGFRPVPDCPRHEYTLSTEARDHQKTWSEHPPRLSPLLLFSWPRSVICVPCVGHQGSKLSIRVCSKQQERGHRKLQCKLQA